MYRFLGDDSMKIFAEFLADESGATAIEYGLIAAFMGVGIIAGVTAFGDSIEELYATLEQTIQAAIEEVNERNDQE